MKSILFILFALAALLVLSQVGIGSGSKATKPLDSENRMTKSAVFAGGCFWCTEADFEKLDGVIKAVSGYTGGKELNPTYEQVARGLTSHVEAVRVAYDPNKLSYEQLLEYFWRTVDPTDSGGQFVDRGSQYRSAIFYSDEQEKNLAEASKQKLAASGRFKKPIATMILPLGEFYQAEDYHQDYYKNYSTNYNRYRRGSGRDQFLKNVWGDVKPASMSGIKGSGKTMENTMKKTDGEFEFSKPDDKVLREQLTPMQYKVTQRDGTEPPFNNEYWDNKAEGIYVDIVSGEPLFSSTDKFKSGTGWPSFTRPLEPENIVEKSDRSLFMVRTEVRSKHASSHLGHVFPDGPPPTGLRYCINSAALRFIPKEDLEKEGYSKYLNLFE